MVSCKWMMNMVSANMALVVICATGYDWTFSTGTEIWTMNVCAFVYGNKGTTMVNEGEVWAGADGDLGKLVGVDGGKGAYFKLDSNFSLRKNNDLECKGLLVVPRLTMGPMAGVYIGSAWGWSVPS